MKESYYFSHDSNALTDPKILSMRCDYGMEGYGVFWAVIEMLRVQEEYRLELSKLNFNALKMLCMTQIDIEEFVNKCINEYKLFETDGKYFWSESLCGRMEKKNDVREKRKGAASKRWEKKEADINTNTMQKDTNAMQMQCKSNANEMQNNTKERKEKERKEKENKENKTAAAITGEDVPTTSPKAMGEDVPTTSPKADAAAEKAMKLMENLYFRYTGRMVNSLDFAVMSEIVELTTDEKLIDDTMKQTKERFLPKFKGDKIRAFKYFEPSLKEAVERERVKKNAVHEGKNTVTNGKSVENSGGFEEISEDDFNSRLSRL